MPSVDSDRFRLTALLGPRTGRLLRPRNPYLRWLLWSTLISLACVLLVDRQLVLFFYENRAHWVYGFFDAITDIGMGTGWYILAVLTALAGYGGERFTLSVARALMWRRVAVCQPRPATSLHPLLRPSTQPHGARPTASAAARVAAV